MKKKFFFKFFLFTVIATLVTFTACKDYDDDIDDLQNQITNLSSVKTDLDGVKADIASALAKANEALTKAEAAGDAEAIKAAKDAADKAQKAADELLPRIEELEAAINAMDSVSQEDLDALVVEIDGLREQFAEMGGLELNNLVLIPDNVDHYDGAIGILVFNQLVTDDCGMISSPTLMRYRVSPTNASEELIKTDELYFEFNAPKVRANGDRLKSKAQFVSLTDGVLTVRAFIDSNELEDIWDEERVAQLQLIVPTKSGNDVISDWVTVDADDIDAEDLFLANVQFKEEGDDWGDFVFPNNLADTKGLAADHNAVVQIKYDQSFDLIDVVNTIFEDENFDIDGFGLTYKFDLKETNPTGGAETDIEYLETQNDTDQQDFITLLDGNKGTVKSKVYSQQNSRTAIGRTPIVRVQLMNDDCVVKTAYIKINWTEEEPVVIPTLEVEFAKTLDFDCEPLVVTSTVQWMNEEVYSALGLTKEEFRARYTLDAEIYNANGEVATELGEVTALLDVNTGLTTDLFEWTYTPTSGTNVVTGYIHLMDGDRIGVRVKVTLTITFPEFSLYGLNNTYWKENGTLFTVNPIVYGNEEASETVDIYADLLNGFLDKDGVYSGESIDIIKSPVAPTEVSFVFDETKLGDFEYFIGTTKYSVAEGNLELSTDKTKLLLGGTVAATIADDPQNGYKIYLDENGTVDSDEAKALVGQRVPVKVVVDQCGDGEFLSTVKSFEVFFIKPIKINANVQGTFTDATVYGSRVSVAEGLTFTDWNNYVVRETPFTNPTELQKFAADLYEYYDIQTAVWDYENATSNLKLVDGNRVPTPGFKEGPVASLKYQVDYDEDENELVFYNNSGSALVESFEIYVPVTISHKWGSTSEVVTIKVNPASGTGN